MLMHANSKIKFKFKKTEKIKQNIFPLIEVTLGFTEIKRSKLRLTMRVRESYKMK
jgi:hypothetical protein